MFPRTERGRAARRLYYETFTDKIKEDNHEWYAEHSHTYKFWADMFFGSDAKK